jgi:hypothetical protein
VTATSKQKKTKDIGALDEGFSYWDVTFDGEDSGVADDFVLNFVDCSFLVGEPLLKNDFLDDMVLLVKKHEHYNIIGNIKEIVDDAGDVQTDKNIYAMLGILKNGIRVGFLIGNLIENGQDFWHVAAVWPEEFAAKVRENQAIFQNALFLFVPITKKSAHHNFSI